jgi:hypothetical protein
MKVMGLLDGRVAQTECDRDEGVPGPRITLEAGSSVPTNGSSSPRRSRPSVDGDHQSRGPYGRTEKQIGGAYEPPAGESSRAGRPLRRISGHSASMPRHAAVFYHAGAVRVQRRELCGWAGWTRSRLPELLVQPPRTLEEVRRVSVRDRARNGDQRCAVEQGLAVIGLDRGVAFLAGVPLAPGRVHPLHDSAATEVATRHRSTVSNTRSTALETVTPTLRDHCCTGSK